MNWRSWTTIAGIVLILVGIPMLVCPGPGGLFIAAGLSLLLTGRLPVRTEPSSDKSSLSGPIDTPYRIRESERSADTMSRRPDDADEGVTSRGD